MYKERMQEAGMGILPQIFTGFTCNSPEEPGEVTKFGSRCIRGIASRSVAATS